MSVDYGEEILPEFRLLIKNDLMIRNSIFKQNTGINNKLNRCTD